MLPTSSQRIPMNTAHCAQQRIDHQTQANISYYRRAGVAAIDNRLQELDREWDFERLLFANAGFASLMGVLLGATVNRKFFALPGIIGAFLLQHAVQGWCPSLPVYRGLGIRTAYEIDEERYALLEARNASGSCEIEKPSAAHM